MFDIYNYFLFCFEQLCLCRKYNSLKSCNIYEKKKNDSIHDKMICVNCKGQTVNLIYCHNNFKNYFLSSLSEITVSE